MIQYYIKGIDVHVAALKLLSVPESMTWLRGCGYQKSPSLCVYLPIYVHSIGIDFFIVHVNCQDLTCRHLISMSTSISYLVMNAVEENSKMLNPP